MQVAGHKQRPPLHPLEKAFLGIVTLQLGFMPWAWGTMHPWSQMVGLGFGILALGVTLIPRRYDEEHAGGREFRLNPWPRLLRFPVFWFGLLLLGYIVIQGFNPSWVWERNENIWWLRRVNDIAWLPTSIDTPFERFNLWRQFIIYATVWLTACALWVGITRRKSLHLLFGILVANALVLAVVGFVHRASGVSKLLWIREFPGAGSFGSFVYRNHAGGYLGLMAFLALGLSVWQYFEGRKRLARSTPAALWLLASFFLVGAVVLSLSRGAAISLAILGLAAAISLLVLRLTTTTRSTTPVLISVMVGGAILGAIGFIVREVDFSDVRDRFEALSKLQANDPSVTSRRLAREAATEMWGEHWLRGVGAGGFRFQFSNYVMKRPEISQKGTYFWEHAHIDWLEIPIELGLTGVLLIALAVAWAARAWWRAGGWRHPLALMVMMGLGQILLHAVMDFPFQCPAILVTWWVLLVGSVRWLELDAPQAARKEQRAEGVA